MTNMIAQQDAVAVLSTPEVKHRFTMEEIVSSKNLAEKLSKDERGNLGSWVQNGYLRDLSTRREWEERNADAIKLALQLKEVKTFPWTNCSNVKFPLVTIAALQFLARISILTKGRRIAKLEPIGRDPKGEKGRRAARISEHMSSQLVDDDVSWMDSDEQCKFGAAILGSAFKKSHFDSVQGINISEYVPAKNFVFDYWCKHVDTAARATHLIPMDANKIVERIRRGLFIEEDVIVTPSSVSYTNLLQTTQDEVQGMRKQGGEESFSVLEQHCWFDFDGDGYAEPYVFSVREDTGHLYRIVARFYDNGDVHRLNDAMVQQADNLALQSDDAKVKSGYEKTAERLAKARDNKVVRIDPIKYFTKYTFIPSPDGGALGLGFGALLGPLNEATNSLLNQLIDSGTMSTTAGGFLGRGVKIKGGRMSFDPFEWKPVDSTGDDLRKNIFPLPVREPSPVLFQLLGVLISYGEKIGSATDVMTGVNPGQNTPAETSRNTVEQGMMLFSGIYARMYRSFREELLKLYELNRLFLHTSPRFFELTQGPDAIISPDDYTASRFRIFPVADPSAVSGQQRKDKADKLTAFAASPFGGKLDKDVITRKWLEAHEYEDIDLIFPDPKGESAVQPPQDPKTMLAQAKQKLDELKHTDEMGLAVADLKNTIALNQAKITELQAKAQLELAKVGSEAKNSEIAYINSQIGAAKLQNEHMMKAAELLVKSHSARSAHEKTVHDMTMDVHDRLNLPKAQEAAGNGNVE